MNLKRQKRKLVTIEPDALVRAGVVGVIAGLDISGATVSMLAAEPEDEPAQDEIGVVRVTGPLMQRAVDDFCAFVDGYDAITARLRAQLADPRVGSVLLVIDSPGGMAAGLEEAVDRMRAAKAEHDKPVVAYVDELAASAAYWIATVADEIIVPRAGSVGSIGCIGGWVDQSKAWQKIGIDWHLVRDPAGKAESHPYAPIADLAQKRVAEAVEACGARFAAAVGAARGLDVKLVRAMNAALYEGQKAVDEKLADSVGSLESAASRAAELGQKRRDTRNGDKQMKLTAMVAALCGLALDTSADKVEVALEEKTKELKDMTGSDTLPGAIAAHDKLKITGRDNAEKVKLFDERNAADAAATAKKAADTKEAAYLAAMNAAVEDGRVSPARRAELDGKRAKYGDEWVLDLIAELQPMGASKAKVEKIAGPDTSAAAVSTELQKELDRLGMTAEQYQKSKADMKAAGAEG